MYRITSPRIENYVYSSLYTCGFHTSGLQHLQIVTGHLKMHHQWAPQNAPPCVVDNLPFCL